MLLSVECFDTFLKKAYVCDEVLVLHYRKEHFMAEYFFLFP